MMLPRDEYKNWTIQFFMPGAADALLQASPGLEPTLAGDLERVSSEMSGEAIVCTVTNTEGMPPGPFARNSECPRNARPDLAVDGGSGE